MKHMLKSLMLGTTALLTLSGAHALAEDVDITLLLVADVYEMGADWSRGGFSRAGAVARDERAQGGNVLYFHAGDTLSPSLFSGFDKGEHIINLLNLEAPDVFVPGNHEFDFGVEIFAERMGDLNSTLLAANMRDADGNILDGFADTALYEFGDVKIGVIGLALETSNEISSTGDLQFSPALASMEASAQALRGEGADIVIAVTHSDILVDRDLINSGAADFILSGHDHDLRLFNNGNVVFAEPTSDAMNMIALDVSISVEVDGDDRDVEWHTNFRVIDTANYAVPDDYDQMVSALQSELDRELDIVLGTVTTPLDSRRQSVRTMETAIGNLIADAMRNAVDADVAMTIGGGIRAGREYEANYEITRKDILTELPFGNVTILLEVSGADIVAALENGLSGYPDAAGRFPQISGMEVVFNPDAEAGSRVVSVMKDGAALDPAATYRLATNDFQGRGGDGYTMFVGRNNLITMSDAKLMANDVMSYIRQMGSVAPVIEGRITTGM